MHPLQGLIWNFKKRCGAKDFRCGAKSWRDSCGCDFPKWKFYK